MKRLKNGFELEKVFPAAIMEAGNVFGVSQIRMIIKICEKHSIHVDTNIEDLEAGGSLQQTPKSNKIEYHALNYKIESHETY